MLDRPAWNLASSLPVSAESAALAAGTLLGPYRIDDRLDAFQHTFMQVCGGLIGTVILALVTVITTH